MCDNPIRVIHAGEVVKGKLYNKDIDVPCGRCPPCKIRRVSEWVFRLKKEEERWPSSFFITLTYNTDNVPISDNGFMTLRKSDVQKFWKRLRKKQKGKIRYYLAGEYGETNWRPHYHAIIFNIEDIEHINDAWQLGNVHVGQVTKDSIAYCAKYIDKQKRIPLHGRDDRIKEYSNMSKGLGDNYLTEQTIKYHKNDLERNYTTLEGGVKVPLSKFYRDKIYTDTEKEIQRKIIISNKETTEEDKIKKIGYDKYHREQESAKLQRHKKFYTKKTKRQ